MPKFGLRETFIDAIQFNSIGKIWKNVWNFVKDI